MIAVVLLGLAGAGCGSAGAPSAGSPGASRASAVPVAAAGSPPTAASAAAAGSASASAVSPASGSRSASAGPGTPRPSASVAPAHPIPASFRSSGISPGAPSDAQVRAELQQMYVAQRQARTAAAANLAGLLPWVDEPKTGEHVSVASVFVDYGLGLACGGLLGVNQIGVAHKTAPCGTLIDFTYNGRTLQVPVIDRGPYIAGREWDLTGATARALGFPGLGPIEWSCASC
jgi:rare lipoprotein A (peptidoglycan hydrolase)